MPFYAGEEDGRGPGGASEKQRDPAGTRVQSQHVFLLLLALRIANALTTRTFFQPDEYYQALEPAWQMAFGKDHGAWITWEWKSQLRSSMHPALFAGLFKAVSVTSGLCSFSPALRAELLIAAPKITQALFAATTDYSTWRLAERAYGRASDAAWASLALTIFSPWQWFCSTRTLSNCAETTLTAAALVWWPWPWMLTSTPSTRTDKGGMQREVARRRDAPPSGEISKLRLSLLAAALAVVLRPTNLLIWICVSLPTLWQTGPHERHALVKWAVLCGCGVLAVSLLADRLYYGVWAFPPLRFVYFNITKALAVFYGRNRGDYYFTEGLPLLLTTALPFALVGIWQALRHVFPSHDRQANKPSTAQEADSLTRAILPTLAATALTMTLSLSLIAHKEVRFIYPLLPALHVLSAAPLARFFRPLTAYKKPLLAILLLANISIAAYVSQVHQRGVIDVLHELRLRHEAARLAGGGGAVTQGEAVTQSNNEGSQTTAAFLMPCHSTPWRSHLVHPDIRAWALTCEPPIDVPLDRRDEYLDEADLFYADPKRWLGERMVDGEAGGQGAEEAREKRAWPQYLVFFQQLEDTMAEVLAGSGYGECWRGFNTHWHDDWRRKGDVVVWCRGV